MKAFIAMPFAPEYNSIFLNIKEACLKASIEPVRADEITLPGPIINQIFDGITNAEYVIAEISENNCNVYYEVGIAHSMEKPTVLLVRKDRIGNLPFDIRHHRALIYDHSKPETIVSPLYDHLFFMKNNIIDNREHPSIDRFINDINSRREKPENLINEYINAVAQEFGMIDAKLQEQKYLEQEGFIIVIKDAFNEKVSLLIDKNGIIRRKKRNDN